jgi:rhodanese-related sulfurtransferase
MAKSDDESAFLGMVISTIEGALVLKEHLFAVASTGSPEGVSSLVLFGSSEKQVQRAVVLASAKFLGRVEKTNNEGKRWVASVKDIGASPYDEQALWDVVQKSTDKPMEAAKPPPGSRGIDQILSDTRAKLSRITPAQAYEELKNANTPQPVYLVDIRPVAQREKEGGIDGSLIIERNVLEWRFDPRCDSRLPIVDRYDLRVIIFCQEGYTSSLAAYALQELGLLNATDVVGGYRAWKEAGLPVDITN